MQLSAIIAITVPYGKDNDELYASHAALQRKYHGRVVNTVPVLFHNVMARLDGIFDAVIGIVKDAELMDKLLNANGQIGLYWGLHGNVNGSEPPIAMVAEATALFYKEGLRFSRINISVCFGAGNEKVHKAIVPKELATFVIGQYCQELTRFIRSMGPSTGADPLNGLMVAAYRSVIVMYDTAETDQDYKDVAEEIYMRGGDPGIALAYLKKARTTMAVNPALTGPQNALESGKSLVPLSLRGVSAQALNDELAWIKQQHTKFKDNKKFDPITFAQQNRGNKKVYGAVVDYIMRKIILEYVANGVWIVGTIAKYSLKQTTRDMISLVEPTIPIGPNPADAGQQVVITVM